MLMTIKNLRVQYGKQTALQIRKPIVIEAGDRIGIIGSNGAGKTTLVKSILGLTRYSGTITTKLTCNEMAVHLQHNQYANTMSVRHIMEAILGDTIKKNRKAEELISYFEFEPCLRKRYSMLSGGQKQRLTIILVMLQDAPLIFYDEVTSGLDFETRQRLMEKLTDWYRDKDNTLCIVSHYYDELELLADKILILDQGQVIDYENKAELFRKYCGKAVIIIDNSESNRRLTSAFKQLESPAHLIALACESMEREQEISRVLIGHNINYKRSNSDIEIMSINAKHSYYRKEVEGNAV